MRACAVILRMHKESQAWRHTLTISVMGRWRQVGPWSLLAEQGRE